MSEPDLEVDADIRRAATLPGRFYHDPEIFARVREHVFARAWHFAGDALTLAAPGQVRPFTLLAGCLDEPLVLTVDLGSTLRCLSNVCTHRANLVAARDAVVPGLRCRYHGRRFALDGRLEAMPEFEGVEGFPSRADDLTELPLDRFGRFLFTSIAPAVPFAELVAPLEERLAWVPFDAFAFDPRASRDYEIEASWALYTDNYLEGFHIPYVHPDLAATLEYASYRTETFPWGSLQVGISAPGEPAFELPDPHPDRGERVGAYYFWLFPATMFNLYPWGLSLNLVVPLAPDRTRVSYRAWVWDESRRGQGAGAGLDRVESEDQGVVLAAQRGVRSRFYRRGRFSPAREAGVHHFHRLLARCLRPA